MKIDFTKEELEVIKKVLKMCFLVPFVEYGNIIKKIEQQPLNDNLWIDIRAKSDQENITIFLPDLRKILEKYKIFKDEKDGM